MSCFKLAQIVRISHKEWKLLFRNPHGLAVLFLMPAIFVLVMSFTLKNTLVEHVDMPVAGWVLEDQTPAAAQWLREWRGHYDARSFASRDELRLSLKRREIEAGVIVRKPWLGSDGIPNANQIEIWIGNRVQPAAVARLRAEITFSVLQAQAKIVAAKAGPFASVLLNGTAKPELLTTQNAPEIHYLYEIDSGRKMTAVQQSVPAWLIFGMFFVVIPISGVLIQERNDGTFARLVSFNVPAGVILGGKMLTFMILNWVQLGFMLAVGYWLVPLLGGDALYLDISPAWFLLMVVSTSAAAVSLALFIAASTRSFDHAAALGSGLNVLLGAVAGVMVPRMLMPPALQTVSEWSPMGWALDGMQSVFLGMPDAAFILPRAGLLLSFASVCCLLSWWRLR